MCRKILGTQRVRPGAWPDLNVNQARTAAAEAIAKLGSGTDPSGSRRATRAT